jgi:uncharacterized membrane protein YoaK (UPF0700 family)
MIQKLPKWIEIGGFSLAFNAGFINAIGLLAFEHQAVSHLTGVSTYLSLALANGHYQAAFHLILIAMSFVVGAAYSGLIIGNVALELNSKYTLALLTESVLLFIAMYWLIDGSQNGHYFASAACGLQNAITTTFSGAIIRTTHLSGLFTDLGVMLGLRLRGQQQDSRRAILYLTLITGFIVGGITGVFMFHAVKFNALIVPGILTACLAVIYWLFRLKQHS